MSARGTLSGIPPAVEQATHAVATAAADLGLDLTTPDAMTLASAALVAYDLVVVVEDETSVGMWRVGETRDAIRRRLRDLAAVQALDEGFTITAREREVVAGIGPAGETLPLAEAARALVTHTYRARFLLAGAADAEDDDDPAPAIPAPRAHGPLRPV